MSILLLILIVSMMSLLGPVRSCSLGLLFKAVKATDVIRVSCLIASEPINLLKVLNSFLELVDS